MLLHAGSTASLVGPGGRSLAGKGLTEDFTKAGDHMLKPGTNLTSCTLALNGLHSTLLLSSQSAGDERHPEAPGLKLQDRSG